MATRRGARWEYCGEMPLISACPLPSLFYLLKTSKTEPVTLSCLCDPLRRPCHPSQLCSTHIGVLATPACSTHMGARHSYFR